MDAISFTDILHARVVAADDVSIELRSADQYITIGGKGFTYSALGQLTGGIIEQIVIATGDSNANFAFLKVPAAQAWDWLVRGATQEALSTIFAGDDTMRGDSTKPDLIRGFAGNDSISGMGGSDSLFGGGGDDTLIAAHDPASTVAEFLRGEEGNDSIVGGHGFDDIHGNQGADTALGGRGNDWVVGGQHNDLLSGGYDHDIVYGNMGNDTLYGDNEPGLFGIELTGADTIRGGQGDDSIEGNAGNDLIWGDRGNDTISGGAGADTFAIFSGGGIDRILDFNAAQGDRVVVENGSPYTVRQVGGDAVVDLGGGDQMILVGVNASSLPAGWIS